MKPGTLKKAQIQMRQCVLAVVTGLSPKERDKRILLYVAIAEVLYCRWQIGVHQLRLKHCRWYLTHYLRNHAPATRYKHWLRLKEIMMATDRYDDWEPQLRGPWRNPSGSQYTNSTRGRKPRVNCNSRKLEASAPTRSKTS